MKIAHYYIYLLFIICKRTMGSCYVIYMALNSIFWVIFPQGDRLGRGIFRVYTTMSTITGMGTKNDEFRGIFVLRPLLGILQPL